jgi:hypothetical protein
MNSTNVPSFLPNCISLCLVWYSCSIDRVYQKAAICNPIFVARGCGIYRSMTTDTFSSGQFCSGYGAHWSAYPGQSDSQHWWNYIWNDHQSCRETAQ